MTFIEAVKVCFSKYADFNGCASRPEFWWWILFTFVATAVLETFSRNLSGLFSIGTFLPAIAVTARRSSSCGWQMGESSPRACRRSY
jgi:uncharacterized membrane protein YhaH (DUF805 family)